MTDIFVILLLSAFGLAAHGARRQPWIEWALRFIYVFACVAELNTVFSYYPGRTDASSPWAQAVTLVMAVLTGLILFKPVRKGFSHIFSAVNFACSGQLFVALKRKYRLKEPVFKELYVSEKIFIADSIPHLNGLWIYITTICSLLANISPEAWNLPMIGIPFPVPIDSLFFYNLVGLVVLAACGCGVFVARKPGEVLKRLGIVKPEGWHYGMAFFAVCMTFAYDYAWSVFTNSSMAGGIGSKLGQYNAGTFSAAGAGPAALLSVATAVCAGIGEEVLMRGGLQPVFGIVPAGILHGVLHGQFNHMPLLMIQIGVWSCLLGVVRKYTNTTTTIIAHGAYNLINTFLFAFNP